MLLCIHMNLDDKRWFVKSKAPTILAVKISIWKPTLNLIHFILRVHADTPVFCFQNILRIWLKKTLLSLINYCFQSFFDILYFLHFMTYILKRYRCGSGERFGDLSSQKRIARSCMRLGVTFLENRSNMNRLSQLSWLER